MYQPHANRRPDRIHKGRENGKKQRLTFVNETSDFENGRSIVHDRIDTTELLQDLQSDPWFKNLNRYSSDYDWQDDLCTTAV